MKKELACECCIVGAGPAGLGVAWELVKHGVTDIVVVDRNEVVGGLARTEKRNGARYDVGPHRFFTKNEEVNNLWHEVLGDQFQPVDRLTRIYYKNKFFEYPIKPVDVLLKMGFVESLHAMFSYGLTKITPKKEAKTFEDWISQQFGNKLYRTFFKTYTEKVWGIPCNEIGAEWAAQRIKGLNFGELIRNALSSGKKKKPKTLVDQFDYPAEGAGQLYETMAEKIRQAGGQVLLNTKVTTFNHENLREVTSLDCASPEDALNIRAKHYFNSAPITHFYKFMQPPPPEGYKTSADALYYREHITVNFLVKGKDLFPDQWIYVHAPEIKAARVANYNNFSGKMVDEPGNTAVSVEYFVFQNDDIWQNEDADVINLARNEMKTIGLFTPENILDAWVVRETESYPTYYLGYKEPYEQLKSGLDNFRNLSPVGRGGLYKYNNQDHAIYSGLLAARNYLKLPGSPYNIWNINVDAEYHESAERY